MNQMQTQKRQPDSSTDGRSTRDRLNEHVFPFTLTGVDYFGPFEVKFLRRTLKRWCCLFTCLTTRAVIIEVTQSLDTESCLAAVTRFIARRGYPKTIISDLWTNFVGAANELKAFMNEWDKDKIESDLAQKKIFWKIQSSLSSSLWWNLGKKRCTREYLPQWNQRSKWSREHVRNLKEGESVWLVDDSVKYCGYKLGRIIEIFTGNDGVVRSARVKMAHEES